MLTLFRYDKPFLLPVLLLITILIWFHNILEPTEIINYFDNNSMPLYRLIQSIFPDGSIVSIFVSIAVLLSNSLLIIWICNKNKLLKHGSYLPALIYIIMASGFHQARELNPILFASTFFLFAIKILFTTYKIERALSKYFNSSFLISVGSLFYFNIIFFELFIFIILIVLRNFNWREWASVIFGSLVPWIFVLGIYFFNDNLSDIFGLISSNFSYIDGYSFTTILYIIFYSFSLFLLSISIIVTFSGTLKKVDSIKKYFILFLMLLFSVAIAFIIPAINTEIMMFLAIPFSIFFANYLLGIQSEALAEVIFTSFIGLYIAQIIVHITYIN